MKDLLRQQSRYPAACSGSTLRMGFRFDRGIPLPVRKDNLKAAGIIQPNQGLVNFRENACSVTDEDCPRKQAARSGESPHICLEMKESPG